MSLFDASARDWGTFRFDKVFKNDDLGKIEHYKPN